MEISRVDNCVGSFLTGLSYLFPTLVHPAFCCQVHLPEVFLHRGKQARNDTVSLVSSWCNFGAIPRPGWASVSPNSYMHDHPCHPYLTELLKEPHEAVHLRYPENTQHHLDIKYYNYYSCSSRDLIDSGIKFGHLSFHGSLVTDHSVRMFTTSFSITFLPRLQMLCTPSPDLPRV